jgi:hypothetical protein
MRTTPYCAPGPPPPLFGLTYDQRFSVLAEGRELGLSFFGTLYAVLQLLKIRAEIKVYYSQGALLLEHNGQTVVAGDPEFIQALCDFEHYYLHAHREGFTAGPAVATPNASPGTAVPLLTAEAAAAGVFRTSEPLPLAVKIRSVEKAPPEIDPPQRATAEGASVLSQGKRPLTPAMADPSDKVDGTKARQRSSSRRRR